MRDVNPESGLIVTGNMDRKIETVFPSVELSGAPVAHDMSRHVPQHRFEVLDT
jgi:hypothetical protein